MLFEMMARAFFTPGRHHFTELFKVRPLPLAAMHAHVPPPPSPLPKTLTHQPHNTRIPQFFDGQGMRLYIVRVTIFPIGDESAGEYAVCIRFEPTPPSR